MGCDQPRPHPSLPPEGEGGNRGNDMGMTIAEKILARKSGQKQVVPGDVVTVEVDTVIMFDNNFMPSIWREIQKLHDVERIIVTHDHRVPAPTQAAAAAHATCRAFVKRFGIKRFH